MKVSKTGGPKEAGPTRKKAPVSDAGGAFAESLKSVQGEAGAAPAVESGLVGNVDALYAVQEVPDSLDQRSRKIAVTYGKDLLDRLDDIKIGVLNGTMPKEKLTDLAQYLRQKRQASDDDSLNEIIAEIELRAEVEIAKLSRRPKRAD